MLLNVKLLKNKFLLKKNLRPKKFPKYSDFDKDLQVEEYKQNQNIFDINHL